MSRTQSTMVRWGSLAPAFEPVDVVSGSRGGGMMCSHEPWTMGARTRRTRFGGGNFAGGTARVCW